MFGNKIQKEESEILKYLNELRDFKKKNGKRFDEIGKIPNKARCGRQTTKGQQLTLLDAESLEINYPLQNTSLTYLKSDNHPGIFCLKNFCAAIYFHFFSFNLSKEFPVVIRYIINNI